MPVGETDRVGAKGVEERRIGVKRTWLPLGRGAFPLPAPSMLLLGILRKKVMTVVVAAIIVVKMATMGCLK